MTAAAFRHFARVASRMQREPDAYWHRQGEDEADAIELSYVAASEVIDVDTGFKTYDPMPVARVRIAEARRIDPSRVVEGKETAVFRNEGRDRIIVRGVAHDVESCSGDGHEYVELRLKRRGS